MRQGSAGLETSDISDKDVLYKTRQGKNDQGHIQFRYTMDDGHIIKSEWLNPDNARGSLIKWCDVVRSAMVAHAEEVAAAKRAAKKEQSEEQVAKLILPAGLEDATEPDYEAVLNKRKDLDTPMKVKATVKYDDREEEWEGEIEEPVFEPKPKKKAKPDPVIVPVSADEDDDDDDITPFIRAKLKQATDELNKAKKRVAKWRKLLIALGDGEDDE